MLEIVGHCDHRLFGIAPAQRLRRQLGALPDPRSKAVRAGMAFIADASAVLDDAALDWLADNPGTVLGSPAGTPLALALPEAERARGRILLAQPIEMVRSGDPTFVRKLRRRVPLLARSLAEEPAAGIERQLYDNSYKGVTDLVTKYVWPVPAFHAVRACAALGLSPNMVTFAGIVLMLAATWLFFTGDLALGLAAAWAMTFLDTVDGKLARVTARSSRLGNLLDHGIDFLHPPLWWWGVTHGIAAVAPAQSGLAWTALWVVLATYVVSRAVEEGFKARFGFNAYIWTRFDSRFRTIVARRNILLLLIGLGLLAGAPVWGWVASAGWSLASLAVQLVRLAAAFAAARREPLRPWLA